ncbi:GNAT family N-acetyltransferase [Polyangium aurulentum]|uniref:GNAT family N-acetyltransferase n=1 Tax=Polyangium aurulentum TaxID=2567896 RepID=UPI00146A2004|nr:GNAT family N-acetyltransferase [Polyangium aurulentum]UQA59337.1 GNAT family N-acetyltransferase [Polyangium aurulentum]
MSLSEDDEVVESNKQCVEMWSAFARRFPEGRVEHLPGLTAALSGTALSFQNVVFLSSPVRDAADLAERCRAAIEYGQKSGQPWLFSACEAWAGDPAVMNEILGSLGFKSVLVNTGMVADELLPPRRPMPGELEIRRVSDQETRNAVGDLTCLVYHLPMELGRTTAGLEAFWDASFHGYVGFVNGQPVSCSVTAPVDGRLYVSWVATHPEHRRKGYAEAVMRRSIDVAAAATGLRRTVLHATEAGRPMYEAMGYRSVAPFCWYALA